MKLLSLSLVLLAVGCAHSLPPEPPYTETVTKVTVRPIPTPPIHGQMMGLVVDDGKGATVTVDQASLDALHAAMAEAVERYNQANESTCKCNQGDPLCACIAEPSKAIPHSDLPAK